MWLGGLGSGNQVCHLAVLLWVSHLMVIGYLMCKMKMKKVLPLVLWRLSHCV